MPPLVVWVAAGRLKACPVTDLHEEVPELGGLESYRVCVRVQDAESTHWLSQLEFGAYSPGLTVIGCERNASLRGDCDRRRFSVVHRASEVYVQRVLRRDQGSDLQGSAVVKAEVNRSKGYLPVGEVA